MNQTQSTKQIVRFSSTGVKYYLAEFFRKGGEGGTPITASLVLPKKKVAFGPELLSSISVFFLALFGPVLARFGPFLIQFHAKTPIFAQLVEIFLGSNLNFKVADFLQKGAGAQHQILPFLANKSNPQRGEG